MSKTLSVTEKGIELKIFRNIIYNSVDWKKMEEAYELEKNKSVNNAFCFFSEPFAHIKWFAKNSMNTIVKIIIREDKPIYIFLKDIKNSMDLYNILKEKIKFVRR